MVSPEAGGPGIQHRTDTVDLLYAVSGAIVPGVGGVGEAVRQVDPGAGEAVVARGNVHRWHNPGPGPCVTVVTMVSALAPA